MKTVPISELRAHTSRILGEVARTRESLVVTRRGRPVAKVIPLPVAAERPVPGKLAGTLVFERDILSPLDEEV